MTKEGDKPEPDVRELRVMKSNYGPPGEIVRLRWQRGRFVLEGSASTLARVAAEAAIDQVYLDCLDAVAAVGRSNRKARRDGQWCAVLTRQPPSVTVTSETCCGGYSNVATSWGTFPVPFARAR
jgi:hypothetical protein